MSKRYPLAVLAAILVMVAARAWVSDDALITFRVVEQLLAGHGPVFNAGERVQVFTHPLWFLVLAAWAALGGSLLPGAMWLSFAVFATGLALLFAAFRDKPLALAVGGAALLLCRACMDFATGGLETPLSFALFAAALWAYRGGRERAAIALLALVALNRLDLLPWVLPFAWIAASRFGAKGRAAALVSLGVPAAAWALFSTVYYGAPLPNTALAKLGGAIASRLDQGLGYVIASFVTDPGALALAALAVAVAVRAAPGARRLRSRDQPPAARDERLVLAGSASAAVAIGYALWCGGDFMVGRFILPALWAFLAVVLAGFPAGDAAGERRAAAAGLALLGALHLVSGQSATHLWLRLGPDDPLRLVNFLGALDERRFYIPWLGAYSEGRAAFLRRSPSGVAPVPLVVGPLGREAYVASRDQAFVDVFALADPMLARVVPLPNGRPGHEYRPLPPQFQRWREADFSFGDAALDALARDLRLAHKSPDLWSAERLGAIARLMTAPRIETDGLRVNEDGAALRVEIRPASLLRGPQPAGNCRVWLRLFDGGALTPHADYNAALDRDCRVAAVSPERNAATGIDMPCAQTLSLSCPLERLHPRGILMRIGTLADSPGAAALYDDPVPILRPALGWAGAVPRWMVQGWHERPRAAVVVALLLFAAAAWLARAAHRR